MNAVQQLGHLTREDLERLSDEDLQKLLQVLNAEAAEEEHRRLTVREFLTDERYLGSSTHWPEIVSEAERIVARDAVEIALCWGTGAGKSALGGALMAWLLYQILPSVADGSFFERFRLSGDKPVFFFCLATRTEQVQQNLYSEVRGRLERSPWFQENFPHDPRARAETWFMRGKERLPLCVKCLPAREEAVLSYDTFCAAVDEAGWFVESRGTMGDSAQEIWGRLHSRMMSRFLGEGLLMNLSAPRYEDDFSQRRAREIEDGGDERRYASRKAIWDTKPELLAEVASGKWFEMERPDSGRRVRIPQSLAAEFARDSGLAWRDYGAVPSAAWEAFDPTAGQWLETCATLTEMPAPDPYAAYYVHGDLALRHDACALAMVHMTADDVVELDRVKIVEADPDTREVELEEVKAQILHWRDQGFGIRGVSFDQFQSADLIQRLRRAGLQAEVVSVDRTPEAYRTLKGRLHEKGFAYWPQMPGADIFAREYDALELIKGTKVDHQPGGSKDVADAVAGATWQASLAGVPTPLSQAFQII